KGYYAYLERPTDSKLRQAILSEAASTPLSSTGLALVAAVALAPTPESPPTTIRMGMDAHEVAFGRNAGGKQEATLDLLVVVFDDKGKPLHQVVRTLRPNLDDATYSTVLKNGMAINVDSDAPEKSARVRLVVHDVVSGLVGSLDLSFK